MYRTNKKSLQFNGEEQANKEKIYVKQEGMKSLKIPSPPVLDNN